MGPLPVNLPPTIEPVRSAEIHSRPSLESTWLTSTIASAAPSGGYSRVTTVAFPRRLSESVGRHAGCDLSGWQGARETRYGQHFFYVDVLYYPIGHLHGLGVDPADDAVGFDAAER